MDQLSLQSQTAHRSKAQEMRDPMMLHTQPGTPAGRPYGLCTVFVPALEASFSINEKNAVGKAWPRNREGRPFSTCALAFSEGWTQARQDCAFVPEPSGAP